MEVSYPALSDAPPVERVFFSSLRAEQRCLGCEEREKISLVALTFFGALASAPLFILGVVVGVAGYSLIDEAVNRYKSRFISALKIWNNMQLPVAVAGGLVVMVALRLFTPFLWASSVGVGVYVGVRLAEAYIANNPSLANHQNPLQAILRPSRCHIS